MKTKKKQIEELKIQLEQKEYNFRELLKDINIKNKRIQELEEKLTEYFRLDDATPSDCKRGSWCGACEFGKSIHVAKGFSYIETFMCGKANSCNNFVQREF